MRNKRTTKNQQVATVVGHLDGNKMREKSRDIVEMRSKQICLERERKKERGRRF